MDTCRERASYVRLQADRSPLGFLYYAAQNMLYFFPSLVNLSLSITTMSLAESSPSNYNLAEKQS